MSRKPPAYEDEHYSCQAGKNTDRECPVVGHNACIYDLPLREALKEYIECVVDIYGSRVFQVDSRGSDVQVTPDRAEAEDLKMEKCKDETEYEKEERENIYFTLGRCCIYNPIQSISSLSILPQVGPFRQPQPYRKW